MPEVFHDVMKFLSTPSARRATQFLFRLHCILQISIHALREEGDESGAVVCRLRFQISIHALREEGDPDEHRGCRNHKPISIHALREEGDTATAPA